MSATCAQCDRPSCMPPNYAPVCAKHYIEELNQVQREIQARTEELVQKLRRERVCMIRATTQLDSPVCGEPAVGKRWGVTWACRDHMGFGER